MCFISHLTPWRTSVVLSRNNLCLLHNITIRTKLFCAGSIKYFQSFLWGFTFLAVRLGMVVKENYLVHCSFRGRSRVDLDNFIYLLKGLVCVETAKTLHQLSLIIVLKILLTCFQSVKSIYYFSHTKFTIKSTKREILPQKSNQITFCTRCGLYVYHLITCINIYRWYSDS